MPDRLLDFVMENIPPQNEIGEIRLFGKNQKIPDGKHHPDFEFLNEK